MVIDRLSKVDFETEVGLIIVLQRNIVHEFGEITKNKAITPFKVIQGHQFWYQSKVHMRLPISD